MEKRVLLFLFLAFLVMYGYQMLVVRQSPAPARTAPGAETSQALSGAETPPGEVRQPESPTPALPSVSVEVGETEERDLRIETQTVTAVFTNRGARLKSYRLKHYLDQVGQPLELVASFPVPSTLPFSVRVDDPQVTATTNQALFAVKSSAPPGVISGPTRLEFEYRDAAGLGVTKSFVLEPTSYVVTFDVAVKLGDMALSPIIEWGPGLGDEGSAVTGQYVVKPRALLLREGERSTERFAASDVATTGTHKGVFQYAGVDDHYFMSVAMAQGPLTVHYRSVTIPAAGDAKAPARELMAYSVDPAGDEAVRFYVGPKDFDQLSSISPAMVRAIDFGLFDVVVVPLLRALKWIYGYVGNYGWAIILLTVAINALMFPLRHKSVVSMRRMQEIQPEAKKIQDRYANLKATDPAKQKMNQELMALYRERGVNPASGCVPMLLTFPVLFAFYALLTTAIELRGAPFVGWIRDLSAPDPFYVTPVLMGITQIWQTWIQPQTGVDPAQQKMMMFMPVIFMFFFLWAPSGVAIYWFVSNLWGIGQQYLTNYLIGPPNIRPPRPAAERRVKQAGSGKTDAASRES